MDKSKYNDKINEQLDYLEENLYSSFPDLDKTSEELFDYALTTQDDALKGYAAYYCGTVCYLKKQEADAIRLLSQALDYLERSEEHQMIVRCYILLALIFQYQGNWTETLDSFFTGLQIAQDHMLFREGASLLLNMSSLCEMVQDYENALYYRAQCLDYLLQSPQTSLRNDYIIATSSMLLRLYNKLNLMDNAKEEMQKLAEYIEQFGIISCGLEIYVNQLRYAQKTNDKVAEMSYLSKTEEAFNNCSDIIEYFDECLELISYYKSKKEYAKAFVVIQRMSEELCGDSYLEMYLTILKEKVDIYKEMEKTTDYYDALAEFYKFSCQLDKNKLLAVKASIQLRINLQQIKVNNLFLREEADTDALTRLPNRRKLNITADQMFDNAYANHLPFAVAMLDIDNFKHFNDTYGHKKGDDCIKAVADILKEMQDLNQFSARYGGDEFIIIFHNLEDEQILERCKIIADKAKAKGEELKVGSITLSIGIGSWIPEGPNRIWDYNSIADETLYTVKNNGRNGCMISSYPEDKQTN